MNTLSILASYGALVVVFQDGFLHQALGVTPLGFVEASSPILLFFALFGLSMDYEVFLLSRVQEAFWQTGDNTHAVAIGLQQSGGIITSAAIIFDQRHLIEPGAIIPNGTSTSGLRVSIGDWSVQGVNGQDHLAAEMANYSMHVDLLGLKSAVLHNGNGLITYGLGGFSYYYSRTRMALSGRLIDHKQSLRVNGVVWMDHQWGNFLTLGGGGWDWFSIQLNNNTEMMLYLIRDATGKTVSTYVEEIRPRADVHLLPPGTLHVDVLNHWKSPVTGVNYPSGWHLEVHSQQLQAEVSLTPELQGQELVVYQSTGNTYWEGAVSIQGQNAGQDVQGEGYVELTGYTAGS